MTSEGGVRPGSRSHFRIDRGLTELIHGHPQTLDSPFLQPEKGMAKAKEGGYGSYMEAGMAVEHDCLEAGVTSLTKEIGD